MKGTPDWTETRWPHAHKGLTFMLSCPLPLGVGKLLTPVGSGGRIQKRDLNESVPTLASLERDRNVS